MAQERKSIDDDDDDVAAHTRPRRHNSQAIETTATSSMSLGHTRLRRNGAIMLSMLDLSNVIVVPNNF